MPTIVATVGSASANSYVTLSEAEGYCESRLNATAWTDRTDDDIKGRALVEATRELDVLSYIGMRVDTTQVRQWPRQFAPDPDVPWNFYFSTTAIPQRVKDATCELALQFLVAGTTDIASLDDSLNIVREKVDVIETDYVAPYGRKQGLDRFPRVKNLIRPLLTSAGSIAPLVRG